jgi:hypothetical protein
MFLEIVAIDAASLAAPDCEVAARCDVRCQQSLCSSKIRGLIVTHLESLRGLIAIASDRMRHNCQVPISGIRRSAQIRALRARTRYGTGKRERL